MKHPGRSEALGDHRSRRLAIVIGIAMVVVALDQVTKSLAVEHLANGPHHLLGPLSLELQYNTGVAFSIGTGLTLPIVIIVVVVVLLLFWFTRGLPTLLASVAIGLVLGGALGNLGDRLFRGHSGSVIDFIHTGFWPTFNVADSSVVCGCALLIAVFWRQNRNVVANPKVLSGDREGER